MTRAYSLAFKQKMMERLTGIEVITKFPTDRIIGCGMNY
jgi:hypothetical protein